MEKLKDLFKLSFPLILSMLSVCILGVCDRLFLAHYSTISLEACAAVSDLICFCVLPLELLAGSIQVLIGRCVGARQERLVGSYLWQMVFFSLLSMLLLLPLAPILSDFFLKGSPIEGEGKAYFHCYMSSAFLFPLGVALNSFYVGIGKTRMTIWITLCAHITNVLLDWLLIFGVKGILLPQGAFGAALATVLSQAVYCGLFFVLILQSYHREKFGTGLWQWNWSRGYECLRLGAPFAASRCLSFLGWTMLGRLTILKGGSYLLTNAIGASILTLFMAIQDGIIQAVNSRASYYIGAGDLRQLRSFWWTASVLFLLIQTVFALPFLVFKTQFLRLFLHDPKDIEVMVHSCFWMWFYLTGQAFWRMSQGCLTCLNDTLFILLVTPVSNFLTILLPIYLAIQVWDLPAQCIWAGFAIGQFPHIVLFRWRIQRKMRYLHQRIVKQSIQSVSG